MLAHYPPISPCFPSAAERQSCCPDRWSPHTGGKPKHQRASSCCLLRSNSDGLDIMATSLQFEQVTTESSPVRGSEALTKLTAALQSLREASAATRIGAVARGHLLRRAQAEQRAAASLLQECVRGWLLVRSYHSRWHAGSIRLTRPLHEALPLGLWVLLHPPRRRHIAPAHFVREVRPR